MAGRGDPAELMGEMPASGGPNGQVSPSHHAQSLQATPGLLPAAAGSSSPPRLPGDRLEEDLWPWGWGVARRAQARVAKAEQYTDFLFKRVLSWFPLTLFYFP